MHTRRGGGVKDDLREGAIEAVTILHADEIISADDILVKILILPNSNQSR